jgi:hypothetical protein
MDAVEGSGGGVVGKVWRRHGGGYYALLAVGTFVYLEVQSLLGSFSSSESVQDFVQSEVLGTLITFGLETVVNTFRAGIWPLTWVTWMGAAQTLGWSIGGYVIWLVALGWLLARREKELRKELGI